MLINEVRRPFIVQNPRWLRRGFAEFDRFTSAAKQPVVLLEGSRNAPAEILSKMEQLAAHLMRTFPTLWAIRIIPANGKKRRPRCFISTLIKGAVAARATPFASARPSACPIFWRKIA